MSYEFYKVIHIFCLIFWVGCIGVAFSSQVPKKWASIGGGVASLLLMVAGMGLLARTKVGWPGWVITKFVLWLALSIAIPVIGKRIEGSKEKYFFGVIILFLTAAFMAIMQPF